MKKKDLLKERKPVKVPKRGYLCHDGPMAGQTLFLSTAYTAILNVCGRTGRYTLAQNSGTLLWQDC